MGNATRETDRIDTRSYAYDAKAWTDLSCPFQCASRVPKHGVKHAHLEDCILNRSEGLRDGHGHGFRVLGPTVAPRGEGA